MAMATATKVLTTLRQEGLVRAVPGVGTVVAEPQPRGPRAPGLPRERRPRETDRGLSRESVVRAGVEIADTEGLRALSMRRVAAEFGVSSMALYRHVASKDELVRADGGRGVPRRRAARPGAGRLARADGGGRTAAMGALPAAPVAGAVSVAHPAAADAAGDGAHRVDHGAGRRAWTR